MWLLKRSTRTSFDAWIIPPSPPLRFLPRWFRSLPPPPLLTSLAWLYISICSSPPTLSLHFAILLKSKALCNSCALSSSSPYHAVVAFCSFSLRLTDAGSVSVSVQIIN